MSTSKIIAVVAASAMVGLFSASAYAESIPQEEIQQYSGSDKPDGRGENRAIGEKRHQQLEDKLSR